VRPLSIRQIVDQLAEAWRQVERAALVGSQAATTIAEACPILDTVIDTEHGNDLSSSIAAHARAITNRVNDVSAVSRSIDAAIQRYRAIGSGGH
jgi:Flp pilus assembly protein CpaB